MVQKCKFDKHQDIAKTQPYLSLDIVEARETGFIKDVPVPIEQYNLMDSTDEIGAIVRDPFTAMDVLNQMQSSTSGENS